MELALCGGGFVSGVANGEGHANPKGSRTKVTELEQKAEAPAGMLVHGVAAADVANPVAGLVVEEGDPGSDFVAAFDAMRAADIEGELHFLVGLEGVGASAQAPVEPSGVFDGGVHQRADVVEALPELDLVSEAVRRRWTGLARQGAIEERDESLGKALVEARVGGFLPQPVEQLVLESDPMWLVEAIDRKLSEAFLSQRDRLDELETQGPGVGLDAQRQGGLVAPQLGSQLVRGHPRRFVECCLVTAEGRGDRVGERHVAAFVDQDVRAREVAMEGLVGRQGLERVERLGDQQENLARIFATSAYFCQRETGIGEHDSGAFLHSPDDFWQADQTLGLCEPSLLGHDGPTGFDKAIVAPKIIGTEGHLDDHGPSGLCLAGRKAASPAAASEAAPDLVCAAVVVPDGVAGVHG
jgi:hypothetical protein